MKLDAQATVTVAPGFRLPAANGKGKGSAAAPSCRRGR